MPYIPDQQQNTGQYVGTTTVLDSSRIYQVDVTSPEFKEVLVRLYQAVNNISLSLNNKVTGYHLLEEFNTGKQIFNPASNDPNELRPSFSKTVNTGPIGPGANVIAHGITIDANWKLLFAYGGGTNSVTLVSAPFPNNGITVTIGAVNITITNGSGLTFTSSTITVEYMKF